MNWSDVGSAVLKYAPIVGGALSSPIGAVAGIGSIVANAFGVNATPEDVMGYINANPKEAEERLKLEMSNNLELIRLSIETFKAESTDRDSARRMQEITRDIIPGIIACSFTFLYFITFIFHAKLGIPDNSMNGMSALEALILSFYFGGMNRKV